MMWSAGQQPGVISCAPSSHALELFVSTAQSLFDCQDALEKNYCNRDRYYEDEGDVSVELS